MNQAIVFILKFKAPEMAASMCSVMDNFTCWNGENLDGYIEIPVTCAQVISTISVHTYIFCYRVKLYTGNQQDANYVNSLHRFYLCFIFN